MTMAKPVRVDVPPALYAWAIDRSRIEHDDLSRRFPKLKNWEGGDTTPIQRHGCAKYSRSESTSVAQVEVGHS
jgi:hypothetical protein